MGLVEEQINVIGLGYVGLTLSLALAQKGVRVNGVESNQTLAEQIRSGKPHFFENGLEEILQTELHEGRLTVNNPINNSSPNAYILCVGAPFNAAKKCANFDPLTGVSQTIGKTLKKGDLVINRSTVPIGTTRQMIIPILEDTAKLSRGDFDIAFAPERTLEGQAMVELYRNPQIIGGYNHFGLERTQRIFSQITPTLVPVSSMETAEMAKLVDNTWRYLNFTSSNQIALLAESLELDAHEVIKAANKDYSRNRIALPSPGIGGSCLLKDPYYLLSSGLSSEYPGLDLGFIQSAQTLNETTSERIVQRIYNSLESIGVVNPKFFLAGFAFKGEPVTSDMRDSTSLWFLNSLRERTSRIVGYDPVVPRSDLNRLGIEIVNDYPDGWKGADCVVLLNNHNSYSQWNVAELAARMNSPGVVYDSWRKLTPQQDLIKAGIEYLAVGK